MIKILIFYQEYIPSYISIVNGIIITNLVSFNSKSLG